MLCRYSGLNDHPPSSLTAIRALRGRGRVRKLVARFDALRPLTGTAHCPADDGSQILAVLFYGGGHRVTISVGLTGCNLVTNGDLHRIAANIGGQNPAGPRLLAELERPYAARPACRRP